MIPALVAVVVVFPCLAFAWWWSSDRLLRSRKTRKVVVELQSGETFQGVLESVDARTLVIRNVSVLNGPTAVPTAVDGELLVPRGDVKFIQRP